MLQRVLSSFVEQSLFSDETCHQLFYKEFDSMLLFQWFIVQSSTVLVYTIVLKSRNKCVEVSIAGLIELHICQVHTTVTTTFCRWTHEIELIITQPN